MFPSYFIQHSSYVAAIGVSMLLMCFPQMANIVDTNGSAIDKEQNRAHLPAARFAFEQPEAVDADIEPPSKLPACAPTLQVEVANSWQTSLFWWFVCWLVSKLWRLAKWLLCYLFREVVGVANRRGQLRAAVNVPPSAAITPAQQLPTTASQTQALLQIQTQTPSPTATTHRPAQHNQTLLTLPPIPQHFFGIKKKTNAMARSSTTNFN